MATYKTHGVCARAISFDVENNRLVNVQFAGGCSGNTQGVARLVEGMDVDGANQVWPDGKLDGDEATQRLEGIQCGPRPTSCPDQLAQALKEYKAQQ